MTARSPHFECGASTSFATRPYIQLNYYTILSDFAATNLKIDFQSIAKLIVLSIYANILFSCIT